jgi:hypothetical protein
LPIRVPLPVKALSALGRLGVTVDTVAGNVVDLGDHGMISPSLSRSMFGSVNTRPYAEAAYFDRQRLE